jgi:hypothetical protein
MRAKKEPVKSTAATSTGHLISRAYSGQVWADDINRVSGEISESNNVAETTMQVARRSACCMWKARLCWAA